jgi:5-methylcytosine-specific restriction endonuclease McrA
MLPSVPPHRVPPHITYPFSSGRLRPPAYPLTLDHLISRSLGTSSSTEARQTALSLKEFHRQETDIGIAPILVVQDPHEN